MANKSKISFEKLGALLRARGKAWYYLRLVVGISPGVVQKLKTGVGDISTATIQRICEHFEVQPGEIMEWIPEEK